MDYNISTTWAQLDEQNKSHYARKALPARMQEAKEASIRAWDDYGKLIDRRGEYPTDEEYWREDTRLLNLAIDADKEYHRLAHERGLE